MQPSNTIRESAGSCAMAFALWSGISRSLGSRVEMLQEPVIRRAALLVSHTRNRVSKLRAGLYRRRLVIRSSEREVGEASVRRTACVAHAVPGNRAGQDIYKQSSSMALAIQDLIRAPSAISGRLLIAARRRFAFRLVGGPEGLSVRTNNCLT